MRKRYLYAGVFALLVAISLRFAYAEEKSMAAQSSQDLKNKFRGTWKLVSAEAQQPNGTVIPYRYGVGSIGYIMYDATGHMAVQLMQPNRPQFASGDLDKGAPEEIKAAFEGYGAYFGTYEIHEAEGFVIHHVEGSLLPNNVGTEQKRFFEFSGDTLILKPPPRQVSGEQVAPRITWQRVK
jgi:hypothetical protein